jgi:cyanophycinase
MHITLHQDNYQTHASPSSPEGERNLDLLRLADLVYFDGGDQSRISNSWLQADGRYSALLQFLFLRYSRGELVVAGTSAGNAFMSDVSHGEGSAFGVLYFANKVDLADKKIYSPTGLADDRNGT